MLGNVQVKRNSVPSDVILTLEINSYRAMVEVRPGHKIRGNMPETGRIVQCELLGEVPGLTTGEAAAEKDSRSIDHAKAS